MLHRVPLKTNRDKNKIKIKLLSNTLTLLTSFAGLQLGSPLYYHFLYYRLLNYKFWVVFGLFATKAYKEAANLGLQSKLNFAHFVRDLGLSFW